MDRYVHLRIREFNATKIVAPALINTEDVEAVRGRIARRRDWHGDCENDIFRLVQIIDPDYEMTLPETIGHDMSRFVAGAVADPPALESLGIKTASFDSLSITSVPAELTAAPGASSSRTCTDEPRNLFRADLFRPSFSSVQAGQPHAAPRSPGPAFETKREPKPSSRSGRIPVDPERTTASPAFRTCPGVVPSPKPRPRPGIGSTIEAGAVVLRSVGVDG